jgi:hypothetical protein
MKKVILLFGLLILSVLSFTQTVSNIRPQTTIENKIEVSYEISGTKFNQKFNVSLYVSTDNGKTFKGPLKEVSGDIGKDIKKGKRMIVWDVLKEMPFTEETLIFDVRVETIDKPIKKKFFISYVGNLTTPLGLRFGNSHKMGWYIEARASILAKEKVSYIFSNGSIENYDKPGYYEFNGKNSFSAYYLGGGFTFQLTWNTFFYLGAGYGSEKRVFEIDEYNYGNDTKIGTSWVVKDTENYKGIELSTGIMQRFGNIVISAGGTIIEFKKANFTAGIGFSF